MFFHKTGWHEENRMGEHLNIINIWNNETAILYMLADADCVFRTEHLADEQLDKINVKWSGRICEPDE